MSKNGSASAAEGATAAPAIAGTLRGEATPMRPAGLAGGASNGRAGGRASGGRGIRPMRVGSL